MARLVTRDSMVGVSGPLMPEPVLGIGKTALGWFANRGYGERNDGEGWALTKKRIFIGEWRSVALPSKCSKESILANAGIYNDIGIQNAAFP